jgi:murein L,D-transpeptidase YafK
VAIGHNKKGPKTKVGDKKIPEGRYLIFDKNNTNTAFHKNLGINYPNARDRKLNRTGGDIKIHGLDKKRRFLGKLHRKFDWTLGCIAVTNPEIDEIYPLIKINTPIHILP